MWSSLSTNLRLLNDEMLAEAEVPGAVFWGQVGKLLF